MNVKIAQPQTVRTNSVGLGMEKFLNETNQLVVFTIDEQRYALHLSYVVRVIHAVEVTPLPKAPETVLGIVNLVGQIIPVINVRKLFGLPEREMEISDQLIITQTPKGDVALLVDMVISVIECPEQEVITVEKVVADNEFIEGVVRLEDGMILIANLDKFPVPEEEKVIGEAMNKT